MEKYLNKIQLLEKRNLELQSENKLKSEFIVNISHELKTPLNSIIGFSSVLGKNKNENLDTKQLKYLSVINSNSKKLLNMLENIINLNKIDLAIENIRIQEFNLNDFIREILDLLETNVNEKAMKLNYSNNCNKCICSTDKNKLSLILIHIISNAIKFSSMSTGIIDINITEEDNTYQIFVKDNGKGIEKEIQEIFNLENKYTKLGVGLSVIKNTIRLLNGNIKIINSTDGTTFCISIPKEINFE